MTCRKLASPFSECHCFLCNCIRSILLAHGLLIALLVLLYRELTKEVPLADVDICKTELIRFATMLSQLPICISDYGSRQREVNTANRLFVCCLQLQRNVKVHLKLRTVVCDVSQHSYVGPSICTVVVFVPLYSQSILLLGSLCDIQFLSVPIARIKDEFQSPEKRIYAFQRVYSFLQQINPSLLQQDRTNLSKDYIFPCLGFISDT